MDLSIRLEALISPMRKHVRLALQTSVAPSTSTVTPKPATATATAAATTDPLAGMSPECMSAITDTKLQQCFNSFSLDVTSQSPAQLESNLCTPKTGCLDLMGNMFSVCKTYLQQQVASQPGSEDVFASIALILNGFKSLCPTTPGGTDGCFASLTTMSNGASLIGNNVSQDTLKSFCDNSCSDRIQKFVNMVAAASGVNGNSMDKFNLRGLFCMQDAKTNEYCYPKFISIAQSSTFDPSKVCPDMCVRRTFLAFAKVNGDGMEDDFRKLVNYLCAKNGDDYCYTLLTQVTDIDLQGDTVCTSSDFDKLQNCLDVTRKTAGCSTAVSNGSPNPNMSCTCANVLTACLVKDVSNACLAASLGKNECKNLITGCPASCSVLPDSRKHCFDGNTCLADVAANNAECAGKINPSTMTFTADVPCSCVDKVVACHQSSVDAKCYDDPSAYMGCKQALARTTCLAKCEAYRPKCYDLYSMSGSTGACTNDCKTSLQSKVDKLGCCAAVAKGQLGQISTDGDLGDLGVLGRLFGAAKDKCGLTLGDKCTNDGKVTGKLGVKGISKADVDANKAKIYSAVQDDLSKNAAVDKDSVTVTGHSETTRLAVLAAGVAFDYTIATEDPATATALQSSLSTASSKGTLDISSTAAAAVSVNPTSSPAVDSSSSSAVDASAPATVSSSAVSVASSVFALVAACVLALAF